MKVALKRPGDLGLPFTQWSLNKLRGEIIKEGVVENISIDTIQEVLKERGVSDKRTKTWKESKDPCYEIKKGNIQPVQASSFRRQSIVL